MERTVAAAAATEAPLALPVSGNCTSPPHSKQLGDVESSLQEHYSAWRSAVSSAVYYLVDCEWWISWLRFASDGADPPGPVRSDRVTTAGSSPPALRGDARVEYPCDCGDFTLLDRADCVALPLVAWKALSAWFGSGTPLIYKGSFVRAAAGDGAPSILVVDRAAACPADAAEPARSGAIPSPAAAAQLVEPCFTCGTPSSNRCARCTRVHYCSASCQKIHW